MASQKALANSLLYALGLKHPASGWSLFYLYALLVLDFILTFIRIPLLIMMIRDWWRQKSSIKHTFFAFLGVWLLIDLSRLGLYTGPVLFTGNGISSIMNLLLIASYYDSYHLYAKTAALVAFSWNRLAIFGFGQSSAFRHERSGPTCFLLVLMPFLPTVLTATVPPTYTPAPIWVYVCLGLSLFFLISSVIGYFGRGYRTFPGEASIEWRLLLFPLLLFVLQLISVLVQQLAVAKTNWALTDTQAVTYGGIQLTYTLFMYHIPLLILIPLSPQLLQAILKNPFQIERSVKKD